MSFAFPTLIVAAALIAGAVPIASRAQQSPPQSQSTSGKASSTSTASTNLVIDTNTACELRVAGITQPQALMQDEPRTIDVTPGDTTVECTSTTTPDASIKLVASVAYGSQQSVSLDVASLVVKASCSGRASTLADLGGGRLRHCVTGADWSRSDSGPRGLVWADAKKYCAKKGPRWSLPTADELAELIDRTGKSQTNCGKNVCNVSPKFKFTSQLFWTDLITGPGMVMMVNLILGGRHPTGEDDNFEYHALCIKRPSAPS